MILPKEITEPTISLSDGYFDVKGLNRYSSLGCSTIRSYLKRGLPHFKVKGKILIKRSDFDKWMEKYRVNKQQDLRRLVDETMEQLKGKKQSKAKCT